MTNPVALSDVMALSDPFPGHSFNLHLNVPKAELIKICTLKVKKSDNILSVDIVQLTKNTIQKEDLSTATLANLTIFDVTGKIHTMLYFDIEFIDDVDFVLDGSESSALSYNYKFKILGAKTCSI